MNKKVSTLILALLLALTLATPALAVGGVTGSLTATNAAPTISSVTLQESDKSTVANSMTPLTEYVVQIMAGDNNSIDDITQIDIHIFYDSDGGDAATSPAAWDADECAIYKWLKTGDVWSLENGGSSTTWTLEVNNDTPADMNASSGEWNLSFKPGKLAWEATGGAGAEPEWVVFVEVHDAQAASATDFAYNKAMTNYSEISMSSATMSFGSLEPGAGTVTANIQDTGNKINTVVIANDVHALGVSSAGQWQIGDAGDTMALDSSGTPDVNQEFGLTIDDTATAADDKSPATPQAVTNSDVTITGHDTDARTSTSPSADEGTTNVDLYMDITIFSGIDVGDYTGSITFTVTNN